MIEKRYGKANVLVYETRKEMGVAAGKEIERIISKAILEKGECRVIFASAPSQNEMLVYLKEEAKIDWSKVVGFHMDEYVGISKSAPQSFSKFLEDRLIDYKPIKEWHPMMKTSNVEEELKEYATLLTEKEIDLVILGIGENGHLAFNDPPVADFDDKLIVKIVELDQVCRMQQVNDGCFGSLDEVPTQAMTITIPVLLKCKEMVAVCPGPTKRNAIKHVLQDAVSTNTPATVLKNYSNCAIYLDDDSYQFVREDEAK